MIDEEMTNEPPRVLDGAPVLKYAKVTPSVDAPVVTRHIVAGTEMGQASALAVATYEDKPVSGYYLLYLDERDTVVTDTWHESTDAALAHAAMEYEGLTWADVPGQSHRTGQS
jgi:hypothetical protein